MHSRQHLNTQDITHAPCKFPLEVVALDVVGVGDLGGANEMHSSLAYRTPIHSKHLYILSNQHTLATTHMYLVAEVLYSLHCRRRDFAGSFCRSECIRIAVKDTRHESMVLHTASTRGSLPNLVICSALFKPV